MSGAAGRVRLLVLDVDGVLTDGRIVVDSLGRETKFFHVRDGLAIRLWMTEGHQVALLSGRTCRAVTYRAEDLGIAHVIQGCKRKCEAIESLCADLDMALGETAVVGDDLIDLPMMHLVGYPMAVADACAEARVAARFVTQTAGGHGAVREAIEHLLRSQGRWERIVAGYSRDVKRGTTCHTNAVDDREA